MNMWKSFILNTITVVIFVIVFVSTLRFFEVDNCLDAGGIFDYDLGTCVSRRDEGLSILWRNHFLLWMFISSPSIVSSILIRYIMKKVLKINDNKTS